MTTSFEDDARVTITTITTTTIIIIRTTINEESQVQQSTFNKKTNFVGATTASTFNASIVIGENVATEPFASIIGTFLLPKVEDII